MKLSPLRSILFLLSGALISQAVADPVFQGLVQPYREVNLSSTVQTFITEMKVREGAIVESGDLLVQLYARSEELELERIGFAVERREFENRGAQNLFAEQLISEDEAMEKSIELRLAQLQYDIVKERLEMRSLRAPISGVVVERLYEEGEMVAVGEPILRLVDIATIYVSAYMTVESARAFPSGALVRLTFAELGEDAPELEGQVEFIDPRVDPASGLLQIRIIAENPQRIVKPGLRARITRIQ
ncbi:MAG: efflux RND transporter periplasmic adaptor subunit [Opitutales bacterium]